MRPPRNSQAQMKRTILRIEKEDGEPLDIEVNGRRLTGRFERGVFYTVAALLALGTLWVTVAVVLPLLGAVLGVVFSIVGVGLTIVAIVVVLVLVWVVVNGVLGRSSGGRRGRDDWDE